jgi:phage gpG-like protein
MEAAFELDTAGYEKFAAQMIRTAETLHLTAFPRIDRDFRTLEAHRFDVEGPGWVPLADSTVRRKARKGMPEPTRILFGWGELRNSLAGHNQFTVLRVTPDEMFMGTNIPYATFHQEGGGKLPARPVVDITDLDVERWASIISLEFAVGRLL